MTDPNSDADGPSRRDIMLDNPTTIDALKALEVSMAEAGVSPTEFRLHISFFVSRIYG